MIRLFKMILDKLKDIYTKIVTIDADTSTINSNILTFPTTNNKLMWKAFLVSNGNSIN